MTIKSQIGEVAEDGLSVAVHTRIPRQDLYMEAARLFAKRSTCLRGQVGCIAVVDNHIVAAGYNGAPSKMLECIAVGCGGGVWEDGTSVSDNLFRYPQRTNDDPRISFPNGCTRAIHAELNLVAFAARHGIPLEGAEMYCTHGPCLPCAQAMVSAGIRLLYYETPYRLPQGLELIRKAKIGVARYGK